MGPTLSGYLSFIRNVMAVPTGALPDNSAVIATSYNTSLALVNRALCRVRNPDPAQPSIYALAVYNLAGDRLVNYAQDIPPLTYFQDLRKELNLTGFVGGIITSSNDESTGESLVVPKFAENLTMSDLQRLKTPWGRQYLEFIQDYGPSIWGFS